MPRVVSIGECMVEFAMRPDGSFGLGFGGDTFNTAWYLRARLGTDWRVDYCTALGDDHYSLQMLDFFAHHGIGTAQVRQIKDGRPGLYVIRQVEGDRHFTYWRGQAAAKRLADDPAVLQTALDGADLAYFSGITLAILGSEGRGNLLASLAQAKARGTRIAFDPNERPALWESADEMKHQIEAAARLCDFMFPTFSDEQQHFGDATPSAVAARYLELGAGEVVVKNGGDAALVITSTTTFEVPPEANVVPIDATAAGDSFNGAYLAARLNGIEPAQAAKMGHQVAGVVISKPGALVPMADVALR